MNDKTKRIILITACCLLLSLIHISQDALIEELYAEPEPENGGETAEGTESKESEGAEPSAESEAAE